MNFRLLEIFESKEYMLKEIKKKKLSKKRKKANKIFKCSDNFI